MAVAEQAGVVGTMALELFLVDGELLINEIATRPHNSGHFSIEAAPPRNSRITCARSWTGRSAPRRCARRPQ